MGGLKRVRPCPICGHMFDSVRRWRCCTHCHKNAGHGGLRIEDINRRKELDEALRQSRRLWKRPQERIFFAAKESCTVYMIGIDNPACEGLFKIGFTKGDPNDRVRACQIGNPWRLFLVADFSDPLGNLESYLHFAFRERRLTGEWFDLGHLPDPVAVVGEMIQALHSGSEEDFSRFFS